MITIDHHHHWNDHLNDHLRWAGPISIAVYAPGSDLEDAIDSILYHRSFSKQQSHHHHHYYNYIIMMIIMMIKLKSGIVQTAASSGISPHFMSSLTLLTRQPRFWFVWLFCVILPDLFVSPLFYFAYTSTLFVKIIYKKSSFVHRCLVGNRCLANVQTVSNQKVNLPKTFIFLNSTNINLQKPGIATPSESYRKRNKLDYPVNVARSASSIINGHHQECGMTMIKMMIITINCHQNDHHWQERGKTNCLHSLCLPLRHWALSEVGRITF